MTPMEQELLKMMRDDNSKWKWSGRRSERRSERREMERSRTTES